jgi:hypothetical protein
MDELHLLRLFLKPAEGEYVPITFIEFKRKLVGWSPELKRSVFIENEEEKDKLKRVREVNLMSVINHLSGKLSSIELNDEEKAHFEEVYGSYLKNGGKLLYMRKRSGSRIISCFEVRGEGKKRTEPVEKSVLSDRF